MAAGGHPQGQDTEWGREGRGGAEPGAWTVELGIPGGRAEASCSGKEAVLIEDPGNSPGS